MQWPAIVVLDTAGTTYKSKQSRCIHRENKRKTNYRIPLVRPMTMETRCRKVFFPKCSKKKPIVCSRCCRRQNVRFHVENCQHADQHCSRCYRRQNVRFHVENCQHADQQQLTTIGFRSRHRINPRPTRFVSGKAGECGWRRRRYQVDAWSRGREVARGVLRSSPKPEKGSIFCHWRGIILSPVFYTAAPKCIL